MEEIIQRVFFRSRPNHSGSTLPKLLTTVRTFCVCFRDGSHQSQSPERGFESFRQPSPQKAGDRSRGRLRRPATLLCRVERCRILVRLSDGGLERLLERALVGSGGTFSRFTPQPWAFHPLRFHDHRHPVFEAPEIADSALGDRRRANQHRIAALALAAWL